MGRTKIFIADDEPFIRNIIVETLRESYTVISAEDGKEALEKIKSEKPDLIILDIDMPEMSGHDICRWLKDDKVFKDTPVIMLTVRGRLTDVDTGYSKGADAYLVKPFIMQHLEDKIKELL